MSTFPSTVVDSVLRSAISDDNFADYFLEGAKPRAAWRIGAEFEKFAVERDTGRAITYDEPGGLRDLLKSLADKFAWEPHYEIGMLTSLSRDGATVSLEPGGQVEYSTPAVRTVGELAAELDRHRRELHEVSAGHVAFVAAGAHPFADAASIPLGPRPRHAVMAEYLPPLGPHALAMMKATASTQVTFDYEDEADAVAKFTVALKLGPIVNALWANSAVVAGRPSGYHSYRAHIWHGMDPARSGLLIDLLDDGMSFERWTGYLLDVPMLFQYHRGVYSPAHGRTFRDYLRYGIDGHSPTRAEWELHLTTVFPEVRLKHFLEVRGADASPPPLALAVPAFWKGLLYDADALRDARALADELPNRELPRVAEDSARVGLAAVAAGRSLAEWNRDLVALAGRGLRSQAAGDDCAYLDPLKALLDEAATPSERALRAYLQDLWPLVRY